MGLLLPTIYKNVLFLPYLVPCHGPKENNQGYYKIFSTFLPVCTEVMSVSTACKYRSEEGKHTRGAVNKLKRGY